MRSLEAPTFSREVELLLCACAPGTKLRRAESIAELVGGELDWERLERLATWHRLVPLLHATLQQVGWRDVPESTAATLHRAFRDNAAHALFRVSTLLQLLDALESAGIPAIPYKGPALAALVYGNLALRQAGDLDILVRRRQALHAREVLFQCGYQPLHQLRRGAAEFMIRSRYHETLWRPDSPPVELHWRFTNAEIAFPFEADQLLPSVRTTSLAGRAVPVFGDEDHLLILAVHGAKHRWSRIEWLCSFAHLAAGSEAFDWDRALARARDAHVERRFLLALWLAAEVFGVMVPADVLQRARNVPSLSTIVAEVCGRLWEETGRAAEAERAASLPQDWFQLRLSDTVRDQLRLLSYRATTPTKPEEWQPTTFRGVAFPMHAVLRPFKVGVRIVPALWSYLAQRREGHTQLS